MSSFLLLDQATLLKWYRAQGAGLGYLRASYRSGKTRRWQGQHTQDREQAHPATGANQMLGASYDLLFQDGTNARVVIGMFINPYEFGQ
jgi:hypothetical protein